MSYYRKNSQIPVSDRFYNDEINNNRCYKSEECGRERNYSDYKSSNPFTQPVNPSENAWDKAVANITNSNNQRINYHPNYPINQPQTINYHHQNEPRINYYEKPQPVQCSVNKREKKVDAMAKLDNLSFQLEAPPKQPSKYRKVERLYPVDESQTSENETEPACDDEMQEIFKNLQKIATEDKEDKEEEIIKYAHKKQQPKIKDKTVIIKRRKKPSVDTRKISQGLISSIKQIGAKFDILFEQSEILEGEQQKEIFEEIEISFMSIFDNLLNPDLSENRFDSIPDYVVKNFRKVKPVEGNISAAINIGLEWLILYSENENYGAEIIDRITPRLLSFLSNFIVQHNIDILPEFIDVTEAVEKQKSKFALNYELDCTERLKLKPASDLVRNVVSAVSLAIEKLIENEISKINHVEWRMRYLNLAHALRPTDSSINRKVLCRISTHYEKSANQADYIDKLKLLVAQLYFYYKHKAVNPNTKDGQKKMKELEQVIRSYDRHQRKEWVNTKRYQIYENLYFEKTLVELVKEDESEVDQQTLEEHFYILFFKTFVDEFGIDNLPVLIHVLHRLNSIDLDIAFQMYFIVQQFYKIRGIEECNEFYMCLLNKIFKENRTIKFKRKAEDETKKTIFFGDSMLRGLHQAFKENNQPVDVICMPGKKVEDIFQKVKLLKHSIIKYGTFYNTEFNFKAQQEEKIELVIKSTDNIDTLAFFVGTNDCDLSREETELSVSLKLYEEMIDFCIRNYRKIKRILIYVPLQRMDRHNNRIKEFYCGLKLLLKTNYDWNELVKIIDLRNEFTNPSSPNDSVDKPFLPYYRFQENQTDYVHLSR